MRRLSELRSGEDSLLFGTWRGFFFASAALHSLSSLITIRPRCRDRDTGPRGKRLIGNQQVVGSNPTAGSLVNRGLVSSGAQARLDTSWTLLALQQVEKRIVFAGLVPKFTPPPTGCHLGDGWHGCLGPQWIAGSIPVARSFTYGNQRYIIHLSHNSSAVKS